MKKVKDEDIVTEVKKIKDYYKDSFLLGYPFNKKMKFLHFASSKTTFEIKTGIDIDKVVLLDSTKNDYSAYVDYISKSEFKQCKPIDATKYLGV